MRFTYFCTHTHIKHAAKYSYITHFAYNQHKRNKATKNFPQTSIFCICIRITSMKCNRNIFWHGGWGSKGIFQRENWLPHSFAAVPFSRFVLSQNGANYATLTSQLLITRVIDHELLCWPRANTWNFPDMTFTVSLLFCVHVLEFPSLILHKLYVQQTESVYYGFWFCA